MLLNLTLLAASFSITNQLFNFSVKIEKWWEQNKEIFLSIVDDSACQMKPSNLSLF